MRQPVLSLRASGPWACFTHPVFKVERVSYQVITPSAARGIFESILWRPAIRWKIRKITVLNPIKWFEFRSNELKRGTSMPTKKVIAEGGEHEPFFAEEYRTQRTTLCLRDVDYIIDATFELTERAGKEDTVEKFVTMFTRRLRIGQCFQAPYLGLREFVANFYPVPEKRPEPLQVSMDLGQMLYDIDYTRSGRHAIWFNARMDRGIVTVTEPIPSERGVWPDDS